jgi:hypothetical protein
LRAYVWSEQRQDGSRQNGRPRDLHAGPPDFAGPPTLSLYACVF